MGDIDLVRQGDSGARERWVAEWWPRVYRMALALTGREADSEDLAQETLIAGLGAVGRFRGESSESTWLYGILLRKYRSTRRRGPPERSVPAAPPEGLEEATALLGALSPPQRIVAALFYVEDRSVEDISGALGIPRATVRWRLFRARQILRGRLAKASRESLCEEMP